MERYSDAIELYSSHYRQAEAMRFTAGLDRTPRWANTTTDHHYFLLAHSQRYAINHSSSFLSLSPHTALRMEPALNTYHSPSRLFYSSILRLHLYPVSLLLDIPRNRNSILHIH